MGVLCAGSAVAAVVSGVCTAPTAVAAPASMSLSSAAHSSRPHNSSGEVRRSARTAGRSAAQDGTVTDTIGGLSSATAALTPRQPVSFSLTVEADSHSHFADALSTTIDLYPPVNPVTTPAVGLQLRQNGKWVALPTAGSAYSWKLPVVPAGLSTGDLRTYELRFVEGNRSAARSATLSANVAAFTDQDSKPVQLVGEAYGSITLGRTAI